MNRFQINAWAYPDNCGIAPFVQKDHTITVETDMPPELFEPILKLTNMFLSIAAGYNCSNAECIASFIEEAEVFVGIFDLEEHICDIDEEIAEKILLIDEVSADTVCDVMNILSGFSIDKIKPDKIFDITV